MEKTDDANPTDEGLDTDVWPALIRIPPDEMEIDEAKRNPLFVGITEMDDPVTGLLINFRARGFKSTGNPVLAFEAFISSIEAGVYPPLNVMRWMAETLRKYHDDQGTKSLDQYFGTTPGRGQVPAFKKLLLQDRNSKRLLEIDCLMYLGATREEAAEMVSSKMEHEDWNHTRYELKDLSASTLEDLHKRSGNERMDERTADLCGLLNPDQVRNFLSQFPYVAPSIKQ
jgi:hypothetical protein